VLAELRAISRDRDRVVIAQQATENRLRAVLEAYHPAPLHLFSTLDRDIMLDFITDYPTPQQAGRVGAARMDGFCRRHGCSGRTHPEVLVERLGPHLLSAGEGTVAGNAFSAGLFTEQLRMLNTNLRAYDRRLDELLERHPATPIFTSFPGVGPVVAATLISEIGEDRHRFPAPGALLAAAGQSPITRASGRTRQVRFRYAANRRMRHMIAAARQVLQRPHPAGLVAASPANHGRPRGAGSPCDLGVGEPIGGQQHDPRPLRQTGPHRARAGQRLKPRSITLTQNQRCSNRRGSLSRTTDRKQTYDTRH
jgi:hypothetical protein